MPATWGGSRIFHCPYCHGYELDGGRNGVLATVPMSTHPALSLSDWGATTYFTRARFEPLYDSNPSTIWARTAAYAWSRSSAPRVEWARAQQAYSAEYGSAPAPGLPR